MNPSNEQPGQSQPAGEKDWKEQFEYWLINNMRYGYTETQMIIDHVARYFSPSKEGQQPIKTKDEMGDEFRMILSHAFLGCDTSDIDKETFDLAINECVKYASQFRSREEELEKEIEGLKGLVEEIFFKLGGDRFLKWRQFKSENNL